MYEDDRAMGLITADTRPKRESMLPDHRSPLLRDRNWPPDQTRSRKARAVAKLRKERR